MNEDLMLKCLIALILGWIVCKYMGTPQRNGFSVGGKLSPYCENYFRKIYNAMEYNALIWSRHGQSSPPKQVKRCKESDLKTTTNCNEKQRELYCNKYADKYYIRSELKKIINRPPPSPPPPCKQMTDDEFLNFIENGVDCLQSKCIKDTYRSTFNQGRKWREFDTFPNAHENCSKPISPSWARKAVEINKF